MGQITCLGIEQMTLDQVFVHAAPAEELKAGATRISHEEAVARGLVDPTAKTACEQAAEIEAGKTKEAGIRARREAREQRARLRQLRQQSKVADDK